MFYSLFFSQIEVRFESVLREVLRLPSYDCYIRQMNKAYTYKTLLKNEALVVSCVWMEQIEHECNRKKNEKTRQHVVQQGLCKIKRIGFGFWLLHLLQNEPIARRDFEVTERILTSKRQMSSTYGTSHLHRQYSALVSTISLRAVKFIL